MTLPMVSMTLGTISTTLGTIPRTLGAVATTIEMISMTVAAVPTTLGTAPTTLGTVPTTLGAVPTTKETSATVKETPSRVTEMPPSWQVMGGGKREFHRAKDAKAAKSQRDAMTIAQPFMAGSGVNKMKKSREGRQKNRVGCPHWWLSAMVAVRNGGRAQAPFVPDGTLDDGGQRVPAMNGWAIFRGRGATAKTATETGALPGRVPIGGRAQAPANGSLGWTNGSNGVCIFSHR